MLHVKERLFPGQGTVPLVKPLSCDHLGRSHPCQTHRYAAPSSCSDKDPKPPSFSCFPVARAAPSTGSGVTPNHSCCEELLELVVVGTFVMHRETLCHRHSPETVLVARPRAGVSGRSTGLSPSCARAVPALGGCCLGSFTDQELLSTLLAKNPPFFPPKDRTGKGR